MNIFFHFNRISRRKYDPGNDEERMERKDEEKRCRRWEKDGERMKRMTQSGKKNMKSIELVTLQKIERKWISKCTQPDLNSDGEHSKDER